jgi:hypothetical protein
MKFVLPKHKYYMFSSYIYMSLKNRLRTGHSGLDFWQGHHVERGSGILPVSYTMGTGDSYFGGKTVGSEIWSTNLNPGLNLDVVIPSSP